MIWLKADKKSRLMYVLTGSNRFELQQGISESLAGRCGVIEMASFSNDEKLGKEEQLFNPELSELLIKNAEREVYFRSYVATYIEKDVRKLISASNELQFRNFISIVALRTSQELHYDKIANSVGIDVRTCKKWISILETSGIIFLLQPYMANISNRIIKSPKVYFMDTGLCAYLCKWPNADMLADCAMSGAFFETYVVSELVKNAYTFNKDPNQFLLYYRDKDQKEIDILFVTNKKIIPIEIKAGISPFKATKNFSVLSKYNTEIGTGLVIDNCERIRAINENAYYLPVNMIP